MANKPLSLIEHIPAFLEHCRNIGLSEKTQENYRHYLNIFSRWINSRDKNITPQLFNDKLLSEYKTFLSDQSTSDSPNSKLKTTTQNYYLIALRALLRYLDENNIKTISYKKVTLPKAERRAIKSYSVSNPSKNINGNTSTALRDKAILSLIMDYGLKVGQVRKLNRADSCDNFPKSKSAIRDYLRTRLDGYDPLFINYRSRKGADRRITSRSIERMVQKYSVTAGTSELMTPETLRWSIIRETLDRIIPIVNIYSSIAVISTAPYLEKNNEEHLLIKTNKANNSPISWQSVEIAINKEILFLKNSVSTLPERHINDPPFLRCNDCVFRKVAAFIVGGLVKTTKITGNILWDNNPNNDTTIAIHGEDWHRKMMDIIHQHFKKRGFVLENEPTLNYGRADLGINMPDGKRTYIEIGTISLFKLWYNLATMHEIIILLVPDEHTIVEFITNSN